MIFFCVSLSPVAFIGDLLIMASYSHVFIAMSINVDLSAVKHKPCCVVAVVLLCC